MIRWEQGDIDRVTGKTKPAAMSERKFQAEVMKIATQLGWTFYHTHDSIGSQAGFPDLVLVRKGRLIFAELKTDKGKISQEQDKWLRLLCMCADRVEVNLWRPSMMERIIEILK